MLMDLDAGDVVTASKETTSERITKRLAQAGQRFHANDNISAFIREGELDGVSSRNGN